MKIGNRLNLGSYYNAIGAARQLSGMSNAFTKETASGLISQQS
jgi:hypothetical protein